MDIYGDEYRQCQEFAKEFEESEIGKHYKDNFCLKKTGRTVTVSVVETAYDKIQPYVTNSLDEVKSKIRRKLCVLPKGHMGRCSCFPKIFISCIFAGLRFIKENDLSESKKSIFWYDVPAVES